MFFTVLFLIAVSVAQSAEALEKARCTFEWSPPPLAMDGTPQVFLEGYTLYSAATPEAKFEKVLTVEEPRKRVTLECVSPSYWQAWAFIGTTFVPFSNTVKLELPAKPKEQ